MEYWTIIDDRHAGPFSVDELIGMGIKPDSPVWASGLPDWVEASKIEELRIAIERRDVMTDARPEAAPAAEPAPAAVSSEPAPAQEPVIEPAPASMAGKPVIDPVCQAPRQEAAAPAGFREPYQPAPAGNQNRWEWQNEPTVPDEPCPPAYLAWSIIVTILCCQVLGIAAIICSAQTKQAYGRGNLAKAKKMSEWTQWLIILSIVLGLVAMPFQLAMMGI